MAWVDNSLIGQLRQPLQAVVHVFRVATWQVGTTTSIEKECVARDQTPIGEKALTSRCVARGMNKSDLHIPDRKSVSTFVLDKVRACYSGCLHDEFGFKSIYMYRERCALQHLCNTFDAKTHDGPANVVGVIVSGKNT